MVALLADGISISKSGLEVAALVVVIVAALFVIFGRWRR